MSTHITRESILEEISKVDKEIIQLQSKRRSLTNLLPLYKSGGYAPEKTTSEQIIECLKADGPKRIVEIHKEIEKSYAACFMSIKRLHSTGKIERLESGRFRIPEKETVKILV